MASTSDASHATAKRYFDDLVLGEKSESRWFSADETEMIEFALQFDPQYFHIDPDKAKKFTIWANSGLRHIHFRNLEQTKYGSQW